MDTRNIMRCHLKNLKLLLLLALICDGIRQGRSGELIPQQEKLEHHLIDIRDPSEIYTVADFRSDALKIISEIKSRGKVPIISGGTMLYLKALREGLADLPAANPSVRESIELDATKHGWIKLHSDLNAKSVS